MLAGLFVQHLVVERAHLERQAEQVDEAGRIRLVVAVVLVKGGHTVSYTHLLGRQGIIEPHEAEKIVEGLKGILKDIEEGNVEFSLDYEDIHMNVEQLLTERIGDTGKRLHTGRSRNDQVALDMRLYVKSEIREIITMICTFMKALAKKSRENLDAVIPGYTHLQRAQPTTFAHYMICLLYTSLAF